jgi:thioredoxin 1
MAPLLEIEEGNFQKEVNESAIPALVYFQSEWCPVCKGLSPIVENLAKFYEGKAKFVKVDIVKDQKIAVSHRVLSTPTLILLKDGKEISRNLGYISEKNLRALLEKNL